MAKRCMSPSCYEIVRDGTSRCEKHTKTKNKHDTEDRSRRDNKETRKIYNTRRWRRVSERKRIIDPLCEECLINNTESYADVVDHITELSDGGEPYEYSNLKSLCHACHNRKTKKEAKKRENTHKECFII